MYLFFVFGVFCNGDKHTHTYIYIYIEGMGGGLEDKSLLLVEQNPLNLEQRIL